MILISVVRALYFVFKYVFCSWESGKQEVGLDFYIKEKESDEMKNYYNEVRNSTQRRATTKESSQRQLVIQVQNLWS
jgi:hypothetical protein